MKNKSLISLITLLIAATTSAFLFIADYWETFQGSLQDPIFYLSFVLPGVFFAISLIQIFPESKTKRGSLGFILSLTLVWGVIYVICLKLFVDSIISSDGLQYLLISFGASGGMMIAFLSIFFYPIPNKFLLQSGAIGLIMVCVAQYALVPALNITFDIHLNDLQSAGVVVFFWQLSLGMFFWIRLQYRVSMG